MNSTPGRENGHEPASDLGAPVPGGAEKQRRVRLLVETAGPASEIVEEEGPLPAVESRCTSKRAHDRAHEVPSLRASILRKVLFDLHFGALLKVQESGGP